MTTSAEPSRRFVLSALITVQILFGINYVVSKIVVDVFPPLVWASLRVIVSALAMVLFAVLAGRKHPTGGWKFFGPLIIFSLLGTVINQGSFLVGLKYTTSTNSAILNTLIPIFTLLIVTVRGQEAVTLKRILGFFSALTGVLVLRRIENFSLSDQTMIGDLLTMLNCFSYALFLSYGKKFIGEHDPIWTTAWMFIYGSIGLTVVAIPDWTVFQWPVLTPTLWVAMVFAVFGATLATYFLNLWALAHAKSSHVALFIYLQPVVTTLVTWLWMGEPVTVRSILSTGLIFLGMVLGLAPSEAKPVGALSVVREG